jgi:hypothetical protein
MIDVFFSYSHEDEELMHQVRQQLVLYDRLGLINKWHDREIPPGSEWNEKIDHHLRTSGIILLLVSQNFFDSDYCYETEMKQALLQHEEGVSVVIPVILRPCNWQISPFGHLQALPKDGLPITEWTNHDRACKDVADGVMSIVTELEARRNAGFTHK